MYAELLALVYSSRTTTGELFIHTNVAQPKSLIHIALHMVEKDRPQGVNIH